MSYATNIGQNPAYYNPKDRSYAFSKDDRDYVILYDRISGWIVKDEDGHEVETNKFLGPLLEKYNAYVYRSSL